MHRQLLGNVLLEYLSKALNSHILTLSILNFSSIMRHFSYAKIRAGKKFNYANAP